MINSIKRRVKQTIGFVEDHPTITACAITALCVAKYTHDTNLATFGQFMNEMDSRNLQLSALSADALEFINNKDMMEEFVNNAKRLSFE